MKTYNYDTTLEWDEEDKTWVARVPALHKNPASRTARQSLI